MDTVSVLQDENILWTEGGDSCRTLKTVPLNWTLKNGKNGTSDAMHIL